MGNTPTKNRLEQERLRRVQAQRQAQLRRQEEERERQEEQARLAARPTEFEVAGATIVPGMAPAKVTLHLRRLTREDGTEDLSLPFELTSQAQQLNVPIQMILVNQDASSGFFVYTGLSQDAPGAKGDNDIDHALGGFGVSMLPSTPKKVPIFVALRFSQPDGPDGPRVPEDMMREDIQWLMARVEQVVAKQQPSAQPAPQIRDPRAHFQATGLHADYQSEFNNDPHMRRAMVPPPNLPQGTAMRGMPMHHGPVRAGRDPASVPVSATQPTALSGESLQQHLRKSLGRPDMPYMELPINKELDHDDSMYSLDSTRGSTPTEELLQFGNQSQMAEDDMYFIRAERR